jgi:hypothetical protein
MHGGAPGKSRWPRLPLTLGYHKITVDIRDQIARTVIEESFVNHTDSTLEGVFYFPLPQEASISGFGMWIGDELVEADVVEKQRAREIYETILRERRDPGLLEWTGGYIFKARVFPIFAHSEKRIKITYTQVLPMQGNRYRYSYALQSEMLKQHPLRELALNVKIYSELPLKNVSCATHEARVSRTNNSAQAAGCWWATKVTTKNAEGQTTVITTASIKAANAESFEQQLQKALPDRNRALIIQEPLPDLAAARQASFEKHTWFEDLLALIEHYSWSQQWKQVGDLWQNAELLAKDKPGVEWLKDAILEMSRRNEELSKRYFERARRIVNDKPQDELFLCAFLQSRANRILQTNERLALHESLRPVFERQIARLQTDAIPRELDPETFSIFKALFKKSQNPQNYIYLLNEFYRNTHDFRLLECLSEGMFGHTEQQVYPFITSLQGLLNEVRDEATVDSIIKHLGKAHERAKTRIDQRALDFLEIQAERRAAELINQPGPHADAALAAMKRAFRGDWAPGERRLMADLLAGLGKIKGEELGREQLRQLAELYKYEEQPAEDRLQIAMRFAETQWKYDRQDAARYSGCLDWNGIPD